MIRGGCFFAIFAARVAAAAAAVARLAVAFADEEITFFFLGFAVVADPCAAVGFLVVSEEETVLFSLDDAVAELCPPCPFLTTSVQGRDVIAVLSFVVGCPSGGVIDSFVFVVVSIADVFVVVAVTDFSVVDAEVTDKCAISSVLAPESSALSRFVRRSTVAGGVFVGWRLACFLTKSCLVAVDDEESPDGNRKVSMLVCFLIVVGGMLFFVFNGSFASFVTTMVTSVEGRRSW